MIDFRFSGLTCEVSAAAWGLDSGAGNGASGDLMASIRPFFCSPPCFEIRSVSWVELDIEALFVDRPLSLVTPVGVPTSSGTGTSTRGLGCGFSTAVRF